MNITAEEIKTFMAILLLSGYNKVMDLKLYWSNSEDTENKLIKNAMSRNMFLLVKHCFHLGQDSEVEGDKFKKARLLIKHLQAKFTEMYARRAGDLP